MILKNTAYSYDKQKVKYNSNRQTDPYIAEQIHNALGNAKTVLNVGAGTGSYEPANRIVTAVEPSEVMRAQRSEDKAPAIASYAESLPFADNSFDASMAILTIHHWPDIIKGLNEMKRVTKDRILILTFDPEKVGVFWLADYCPEMAEVDRARFPKLEFITQALYPNCIIQNIPVPLNCVDGFNEAFYGRPEAFLDESIRRSQSFWDFLPEETEQKAVANLTADLNSGKWDKKYGYLRKEPKFDGALRLVISEK